jgi:adenine-specific DNA glycosylase
MADLCLAVVLEKDWVRIKPNISDRASVQQDRLLQEWDGLRRYHV